MATSTDGYALLTTITLPGNVGGHGDWVAYDPDTNTVWLAQSPDNNVVVIDAATNSVKAVIPNIGNANGVAFSSQYAFVADVTNNTTDVIDKRTFQVVAKVAQTGTTPDSETYISSTNQVAVASDDNNVEDLINAATPFSQTQSIQLQPTAAVSGPDVSTYVASKDLLYQPVDNVVDVINPHTGAIVATWTLLPSNSSSVKPGVYDPTTNTFLFGTTNKQVLVVNADTGAVLKTIAISGSVDESSIDVSGRLAFFGDKAGAGDIVNLDSDTLVGGLPAEANMHTLAVDPTTHDVYVYENNRNTVDVYAQVPQAPSFSSSYVSTTAKYDVSALDTQILSGALQMRSPNANGSVPTVSSGSGGVLVDNTGGRTLVLPSSYVGAVLNGSAPDTVFGGGGFQTFVSGSAGSELVLNGGTNFVAAAGNNIIFDNGGTANLALDNGNNTLVENGANSTINAGTGKNVIGINAGAGGNTGTALINSTGQDTVIAGAGSTTVDASFSTGSASELVFDNGGRLTFFGGAGSATVVGGSGTEFVRGGSGSLVASGTGTGGNLLVGGSGNATLFGGGSGDTLVAGIGNNILVAGAGNETLTGAFTGYAVSGRNVFIAGSGNDSISTGNGGDTVFAGSGQATVNLGAGADLVALFSGRAGGNLVLNNFSTSADRVTLQGYGAGTAANAVAQEMVVNGSAVLALSDGTKITFTGVAQVGTSSFV